MAIVTVGWFFLIMAFAIHWVVGVIVSVAFLLIVLLPVEGFDPREQEGEDIALMKLNRGKKMNTYYLEVKDNIVIYAYDNSDMYDLDGGAYEEGYRKGRIKIYETSQCEEPILRTFVTEPSRELFTFAPFSTKREYVFYVPEGTVLYSSEEEQKKKDIVSIVV